MRVTQAGQDRVDKCFCAACAATANSANALGNTCQISGCIKLEPSSAKTSPESKSLSFVLEQGNRETQKWIVHSQLIV